MNARVETAPTTQPSAANPYEVLGADVVHRLRSISDAAADALTMHHGDAADRFGQLIDQLRHEYMRLQMVREMAQEAAEARIGAAQ